MTRATDVDRLLGAYVAEYRAGGEADPASYLEAVQGAERAELAALIDGFLARQPRQAFDAAAFTGSPAEALVEALDVSLRGQAGLWPALLPRLRADAQLRRSEVVERLAEELGAPQRREKVAGYYHEMEQGLLPAAGVSDRVLEALARIMKVSAATLREAGAAIAGARAAPAGAPAFARAAPRNAPEDVTPGKPAAGEAELDEVDLLFRRDA